MWTFVFNSKYVAQSCNFAFDTLNDMACFMNTSPGFMSFSCKNMLFTLLFNDFKYFSMSSIFNLRNIMSDFDRILNPIRCNILYPSIKKISKIRNDICIGNI
mmetsp:Transcript_82731/g.101429  ORF Transcript_82731/g.101429 Transcript_82731/m.101429 type:complete len:102 (+) Transcript_82731:39-344(+)